MRVKIELQRVLLCEGVGGARLMCVMQTTSKGNSIRSTLMY